MSVTNCVHPAGMAYRMSDTACTPSPFAYTTPLSVMGFPSVAPISPLLRSRSAGPHALLIDVHDRSLRYCTLDPPLAVVVNVLSPDTARSPAAFRLRTR